MPFRVDRGQTAAQLFGDLESGCETKTAVLFEDREQGGAGHELHRQAAQAAGLHEIVDADHVGVRDPPRQANLLFEFGDAVGGVRKGLGPHHLERDILFQLEVRGPEDDAHAAAAELRTDLVAFAEDLAE